MDYDDENREQRSPHCDLHGRMTYSCGPCDSAELARLRTEIERLRANAEADNSHAMSTAADNERLAARIAELERIVVWLAEQVDCVTLPSTGGRKTVRFEGFSLGVKVISIDGTPAGLIAAVKEEMGDG